MSSHEMPLAQCPRCFARLDRAGEIDDKDLQPGPGDITVCLHCGGIAMFTDDMTLVHAPEGKITIEAYALSLLYYKPVIRTFIPGDGKVH
jgi:hypothetical protein